MTCLNALKEDDKPSEKRLEELRQEFFKEYEDFLSGTPEKLPPLREVNHQIPLIDENKQYVYPLPRCPDTVKGELHAKIERYMSNGWWINAPVTQAAPLLCVPKKNSQLRTVFDLRLRNENTH